MFTLIGCSAFGSGAGPGGGSGGASPPFPMSPPRKPPAFFFGAGAWGFGTTSMRAGSPNSSPQAVSCPRRSFGLICERMRFTVKAP